MKYKETFRMASPTTVYITPRQRKRLFERARRRKTTFSEELRSALDLYLDLPSNFDGQVMAALARQASESANRSITRLDEAIASVRGMSTKLDEFSGRLDDIDKKRL
jgi:hypothetical protein